MSLWSGLIPSFHYFSLSLRDIMLIFMQVVSWPDSSITRSVATDCKFLMSHDNPRGRMSSFSEYGMEIFPYHVSILNL